MDPPKGIPYIDDTISNHVYKTYNEMVEEGRIILTESALDAAIFKMRMKEVSRICHPHLYFPKTDSTEEGPVRP